MPNTREKLIDAIEKEKPYIPTEDYEVGYNNGLTMAQAIVTKLCAEEAKWIPVTERLPESLVPVLCWYEYFRYGNYNCMYQTYGLGYYFRDGMWGGEVSNGQNCKVLAWMPLPLPPKGE